MNLRIDIPPELEEQLKTSAKNADVNVQDFVLLTLSERLATGDDSSPGNEHAEPLSQWLVDWATQFPILTHQIDDSRESIYADRDG